MVKTYVLLSCMDADAPVYQQTADKQRVKVTKIPFHRPTLRQTFQDEKGKTKTIRYKATSKTIDQNEQIEVEKILANEPFTQRERDDLMFRFAVLTTNKEIAQIYLEAHPECEGFKGDCEDVRQPRYKLMDAEVEAKLKNSDIRLRVKAANKVLDLSLEDAQSMLIRLNGSYFKTPPDLEDCQNLLMEFVDDAEEAGLNDVLKDDNETTIDEKTTVLIGKLINAEILSFDKVTGSVAKKGRGKEWVTLRDISIEYSLDERMRLFSNFLNTADGAPLKTDLENDLKKLKK